MVAAEQDLLPGEFDPVGDGADEAGEILRRHARIAAVLIDLVTGRFDQHRRFLPVCAQHGSFDDERVRGTDRRYSARAGTLAPPRDVDEMVLLHDQACCSLMNRSSSARVEAPSIGPKCMTARAPEAAANSRASRGLAPLSQKLTKVAPKQSPAPVG